MGSPSSRAWPLHPWPADPWTPACTLCPAPPDQPRDYQDSIFPQTGVSTACGNLSVPRTSILYPPTPPRSILGEPSFRSLGQWWEAVVSGEGGGTVWTGTVGPQSCCHCGSCERFQFLKLQVRDELAWFWGRAFSVTTSGTRREVSPAGSRPWLLEASTTGPGRRWTLRVWPGSCSGGDGCTGARGGGVSST